MSVEMSPLLNCVLCSPFFLVWLCSVKPFVSFTCFIKPPPRLYSLFTSEGNKTHKIPWRLDVPGAEEVITSTLTEGRWGTDIAF